MSDGISKDSCRACGSLLITSRIYQSDQGDAVETGCLECGYQVFKLLREPSLMWRFRSLIRSFLDGLHGNTRPERE